MPRAPHASQEAYLAMVAGSGPLTLFDGSPIRGKWKLSIYDTGGPTTSTFDSWGLKITAAKPVTG